MAQYVPLRKPLRQRPESSHVSGTKRTEWGLPVGLIGLIRNQLTISSWLALGGCLQCLLFLVGGRIAFVPAFLLIFYRIVDAALMTKGLKPNPALNDVIFNKFAVHYPDSEGKFGGKPANKDIVVFHIGARNNHPLGMFAPGFKELGDYFDNMAKDIEKRSEEYGLMGITSYTAANETATNNEIMTVMFFENFEGLQKFAHDPLHREAWNWWNRKVNSLKHISIWHEVFRCPAGNWEGIYVNSHPRGLAATTVPLTLEKDNEELGVKAGEKAHYYPIVDARKGLLKTSAGRMSATGSDAKEHEKYNDDPYENYGRLNAV
ncbi:Transcriptional regulator protein [Lasiodiplodia theobromae]|uniref:Transcriptional regulator protein n=1 Tax=Lasiodiplodia theobromae TaxID=45133 RepID=UPI0015C363E2|nr:Transcriptional regulator protein [Lasiodiplodia theobromae]KAF4535305.1 Transcriptional regulator protein [Lasiodiplodia theobromae]